MGGTQSKPGVAGTKLLDVINQLAAGYILNDSFKSRLHLSHEENCKSLLTVVAAALDSNLDKASVEDLAKKLKTDSSLAIPVAEEPRTADPVYYGGEKFIKNMQHLINDIGANPSNKFPAAALAAAVVRSQLGEKKADPAQAQAPADPAQAQADQAQAQADPAQAQAPADPAQAQAPADPAQAQAPADPAQAQAPADPAQAPADPAQAQAQAPVNPAQAQAPVNPAQAQAPADPTQAEQAPVDPAQAQPVQAELDPAKHLELHYAQQDLAKSKEALQETAADANPHIVQTSAEYFATKENFKNKQKLCNEIAKMYVLIAHLFVAILGTIEPVVECYDKDRTNYNTLYNSRRRYLDSYSSSRYSSYDDSSDYNDPYIRTPLYKIGSNLDTVRLNKNAAYIDEDGNIKGSCGNTGRSSGSSSLVGIRRGGLCTRRLQALINNQNILSAAVDESVTVHPNVCNFNVDAGVYDPTTGDQITRILGSEAGIESLEKLYYDQFDPVENKFTSMSPASKKQYEEDIQEFYNAFSTPITPSGTGSVKPIPKTADGEPTIKNIGKIPLRNWQDNENCMKGADGTQALYKQKFVGIMDHVSINKGLFKAYALHLKKMVNDSDAWQIKLMNILTKIFVKNKKNISINPTLDYPTVQRLVVEARGYIVKMYIECEENFLKGVKIFESISETIQGQTTTSRINQLSDLHDELSE